MLDKRTVKFGIKQILTIGCVGLSMAMLHDVQDQKKDLKEVRDSVNPLDQEAAVHLRARMTRLASGADKRTEYRIWSSFVLDERYNVCLRTFNISPFQIPKTDDEIYEFILKIIGETYFMITPKQENPAYSIKSDMLALENTMRPKPRYLLLLLDILTNMDIIHSSACSEEVFCYDPEEIKNIGADIGADFLILFDFDPKVNFRMGGTSGVRWGSERHVSFTHDSVELNINQGKFDTLDIVVMKGPRFVFEFPGFSTAQKCAFLNYMFRTFAREQLPRIRQILEEL